MKNYQAIIISCFLVFLVSIGYWQSHTVIPFLLAFITAYLLQPLAHWLEKKLKFSKAFVAMLIISLFLFFIALLTIVLSPFLYEQISLFIKKLPIYQTTITTTIVPNIVGALNEINPAAAEKVSLYVQGTADRLLGEAFHILNNLWQYTLSTISFFANIVLVPFVLYYFIRDWDRITHTIEDLIPVAYKARYKFLTSEINNLLAAYIRGQLNACLILAAYYSFILGIFRIDFPLLLGALSGFLIIIPFIGFALSLTLSILVAYIGGHSLSVCMYILIAYIIGHAIEGYILIPRLVGRSIGLHPVWIVFAILALGNLYGIIGIIVAIPVAGITKILLKFAFGYYKNSELYTVTALEK
ncbi:MAG: permease PerM [Rickettsiaceae bacterium]|jgi:predicted PurR-regulated permease PerM|nr:permease PerM [Rickettsiaceae bacterium]